MRKVFVRASFILCSLSGQAQEKIMNILRTDGTSTQTRVAELKQISFLTVDEGTQGLLVRTLGDETAGVYFETNPVVTVSNGKLIVKPNSSDAIELEITEIAEIYFGDASTATSISTPEGFSCVLQNGAVLLRGIPDGVKPNIYSLEGQTIPTPPFRNGELQLSRATLGTGIFIVKVGTFSTKIRL